MNVTALLLSSLLFAAAEPANLGGKTVRFGNSIVVAVPDGWYRATPDVERETESWVLMYVGKAFDPERGDMPHGFVHINREVDEMDSVEELQTYYRNVEKRLGGSGWRLGEIQYKGKSHRCFTLDEDDSTTILVQLPFGRRSVTTYTIVPRKGAGMPKYSLRLLEAISLK